MSTDLVKSDPCVDAVLKIIPVGNQSADKQRRFDDFRIQTKAYILTILATIPAGKHRDNAFDSLRISVTACVMAITHAPEGQR